MNICITFSPDWLQYVEIALYALFKTNPAPIKVYLISDPETSEHMDKIKAIAQKFNNQCIFIKVKNHPFNNKNIDNRFTVYTLYRLLIPALIACNRVLYIDADALVNGNITELYNTDLGDNLIAGVIDTGIGCGSIKTWHEHLKSIKLTPDDIYINGGVQLIDVQKIRELDLMDKWIEMANATQFACHDQDIINISCRGRIKPVDNKFNVSQSCGSDVPKKDIRIVHYTYPGHGKPWNNDKVVNYEIWDKWQKEYNRAMGA